MKSIIHHEGFDRLIKVLSANKNLILILFWFSTGSIDAIGNTPLYLYTGSEKNSQKKCKLRHTNVINR